MILVGACVKPQDDLQYKQYALTPERKQNRPLQGWSSNVAGILVWRAGIDVERVAEGFFGVYRTRVLSAQGL